MGSRLIRVIIAALFLAAPSLASNQVGPANTVYRMPNSGNLPKFGAIDLSKSAAVGSSLLAITNIARVAPTVQVFTSGSGTYSRPSSPTPLYLRVRMVGGGGGGGGGGTGGYGTGGTGGNTTFGSSLLVANGGVGGVDVLSGGGGTGGTASLGTGPVGLAVQGGDGGVGTALVTINSGYPAGGGGASSPLSGGGEGGQPNGAGLSPPANSGAGGGGGGGNYNAANVASGSGGGAGGFVDAIITSPSSTYSYAVGAAGTAGTAGTNGQAGGAGAAGIIIVEEFYQ